MYYSVKFTNTLFQAYGLVLSVSPSGFMSKAPIPVRSPIKLLHPGPPFNHKTRGSSAGFD